MTADQGPARLPRDAVDHGDRLELEPGGLARVLGMTFGVVLVVAGVALAVLGPGDFADDPIARMAIGAVMLVAGAAMLVTRGRKMQFDQTGVTQRGVFGSRSLTWAQVREIEVDEVWGRPGGIARRVGGLSISMGPGGRGPGTGVGRAPLRRVVVLRVDAGDDGRDLRMTLNRTKLKGGEAILDVLRERGWIPDQVRVSVDADG